MDDVTSVNYVATQSSLVSVIVFTSKLTDIYFLHSLLSTSTYLFYLHFHSSLHLQRYRNANSWQVYEFLFNPIVPLSLQHIMNIFPLILIGLLLNSVHSTNNQICSSTCASWMSACYNITYNGCIVCDTSIFNEVPHPTQGCTPKSQVKIEAADLKNPIDLTSFDVTSYSSFTCSGFEIAGKFVNGDKISKIYELSQPHYSMKVKFSIVYIGVLSTNDQIFVWIDDVKYPFNYSCVAMGTYCSARDCIRTIEQDFEHSGKILSLEINGSTSAGSSWGIKDLIIASYLCHPWCQSCYGPQQTQCLFCIDGYYLQGNVCVDRCSNYTIESSKFCTTLCPNGYYPDATKKCELCYEGCQMCNGPTLNECLMRNVAGPSFYKNIGLNLLFIVTGVTLVAMAVYCFIRRCYRKEEIEINDTNNDLGKKMVHETSENFIEDNTFNNSMHDKSRDGLMYQKEDPRNRKVSMLEQIQL